MYKKTLFPFAVSGKVTIFAYKRNLSCRKTFRKALQQVCGLLCFTPYYL